MLIWVRTSNNICEIMPILSPDERKGCFCEVEKGFTPEQVEKEAGRCLRCDVLKISIL